MQEAGARMRVWRYGNKYGEAPAIIRPFLPAQAGARIRVITSATKKPAGGGFLVV